MKNLLGYGIFPQVILIFAWWVIVHAFLSYLNLFKIVKKNRTKKNFQGIPSLPNSNDLDQIPSVSNSNDLDRARHLQHGHFFMAEFELKYA